MFHQIGEKSGLREISESLYFSTSYIFVYLRPARTRFTIPLEIFKKAVQIDKSSILIIDDKNRRWRLPLGNNEYTDMTNSASMRICREVVTERDLFNCHGTFYELPAESVDGYAKIRPISSHKLFINDYASYRGLLVMTGIKPNSSESDHIIHSQDGQAAVWVGVIDDLWKLGKPTGHGGPWKDTHVYPGVASDPYLIGYYDNKSLEISHDHIEDVAFKIEVLPLGHDSWLTYKEVSVGPNEVFKYQFPIDFQARWIRFVPDKQCNATAYLEYN